MQMQSHTVNRHLALINKIQTLRAIVETKRKWSYLPNTCKRICNILERDHWNYTKNLSPFGFLINI